MPKSDNKTIRERFNERYKVNPTTGCWEWTAGLNGKGYAYMFAGGGHNGSTLQAYKLAYVWKFGPVPKGLELDHICRNRKCVNPDHLRAVTRRSNQMNSATTFGAINAAKIKCPKGHPYTQRTTKGKVYRACPICLAENTRRWRNARKAVDYAL